MNALSREGEVIMCETPNHHFGFNSSKCDCGRFDRKHTNSITRLVAILDMELRGELVRDCKGCAEFYDDPGMPLDHFAPSHKASERCRSGGRNHCTCRTCF